MSSEHIDQFHRRKSGPKDSEARPDDVGREVDHRPVPGAFGVDDEGFVLERTAEVDEDHVQAHVVQAGGAVHHARPHADLQRAIKADAHSSHSKRTPEGQPRAHPASTTEPELRRPRPWTSSRLGNELEYRALRLAHWLTRRLHTALHQLRT